MEKIEALTKSQVESLSSYRDKWLTIGLSTEPTDREKTKAAISQAYQCAGLNPPRSFMFLRSPVEGAIAAASVQGDVRAKVRDDVRSQVRAKVGGDVREEVGEEIWTRVGSLGRNQVKDEVCDQVGSKFQDQVSKPIFGSHDAHWLGFYSFFYDNFGFGSKVKGLVDTAKNCGWWWPFRDTVIVTDRPETIKMSDGLLHCADGPSIKYRDGFEVYSWRGQRIPKEWITNPESLTPAVALTHWDIDQRKAAYEILGRADILERKSVEP